VERLYDRWRGPARMQRFGSEVCRRPQKPAVLADLSIDLVFR
jgi:hypothetical protein